MRIAIAADDNRGLEGMVSHHFGRCPYFLFVDIEDGEITGQEIVENPYFASHQPGMVPAFIQSQNAEVMISGGMGRRAIGFFDDYGIATATGAMGTARQALENYLDGVLRGAAPCRDQDHHSHGDHPRKDDCENRGKHH
ncbi:MAG: NifB/NifX family molybdenum-iron cluster-binding protein [Anaerolineales bacterium]|jgi:predicted Fe-Mo cluster-binding NifX family protein